MRNRAKHGSTWNTLALINQFQANIVHVNIKTNTSHILRTIYTYSTQSDLFQKTVALDTDIQFGCGLYDLQYSVFSLQRGTYTSL